MGGEGEDCGSSLVGSSECNTVSLGIPFDCCDFEIWGAPLEVRDALMSWTVVASSLLESGGGMESKTMARRVGWWALLGLVGALGWGLVAMGGSVFWLVAASA